MKNKSRMNPNDMVTLPGGKQKQWNTLDSNQKAQYTMTKKTYTEDGAQSTAYSTVTCAAVNAEKMHCTVDGCNHYGKNIRRHITGEHKEKSKATVKAWKTMYAPCETSSREKSCEHCLRQKGKYDIALKQ